MQEQAQILQNELKKYAQTGSEDSKLEVLNALKTICKNHENIKKIRVKPRLTMKCMLCAQYIGPEQLKSFNFDCPCYTSCHLDCLKKRILEVTEGFLDDEDKIKGIFCKSCGKKILGHVIQYIFGDEYQKEIDKATNRLIEALQTNERKVIDEEYMKTKKIELPCDMPNCKKPTLIEKMKTMECNHRFCPDCIKNYINNQCDNANIKEIKCPLPDCVVNIDWDKVQAIGDFDKTAKMFIRIQPNPQNFAFCTKCQNIFYLEEPNARPNFACDNCR